MTTRPTAELRRQVISRAAGCCEYCLIHQALVGTTHQVDHVISEKPQGETTLANLALSYTMCNRRKGSDIGSLDPVTGDLIPLCNPRIQLWSDHFDLDGAHIIGLTAEGRTTVNFLQLNAVERLIERADIMQTGLYPPPQPG